jgi:hypothetical protein
MTLASELDGQKPSTNDKASGTRPEAARLIGSVKKPDPSKKASGSMPEAAREIDERASLPACFPAGLTLPDRLTDQYLSFRDEPYPADSKPAS